ncbi:alpha/beta fold hydrolase [Tenacibaculum sp. TC6]|uniref:alpha/beta fold hydrolase n=1 Tax=Tenacibaculum sp. TC6 TaxID=3423223 RepID=UPI003D35F9AB
MRRIKKILKITGFALLILFIGVYVLFVSFSSPSSDARIVKKFASAPLQPEIKYKYFQNFKYRTLSICHNHKLPTLIFIHGSIGSSADFIKYMTDASLLTKYNMIAYDRIGYNYKDTHHVQESIAFERDLLDDLISKTSRSNSILVGYSYGGPIALATQKTVKKIVLLAPAVYSEVEPMPWMVNFYKWKITRWLVPAIWKEASREKISHPKDLKNFEHNWASTPNTVLSIHGNTDWIVPHSNSEYLLRQFPKHQFTLITLPDTGHGLLWSQFDFIKQQLLNL